MELIVTTFIAVVLAFFGHLGLVIADRFERPRRPRRVLPEPPDVPPKQQHVPCVRLDACASTVST